MFLPSISILLLLGTGTAKAQNPNQAYFNIVNKFSGKSMDLISGNTANGAVINLWTSDVNSQNQRWALEPTENGDHFKIISQVTGKCACMDADSTGTGAQLHDWDYTGNNPSQQFDLVDAGNGWFRIKNVRSGLLLDDSGYGTADGTKIDQWTDNTGTGNSVDNQLWRVQPWGTFNIRACTGSSEYIACQGGQVAGAQNGAAIVQFGWQNNPWFEWNFTTEGDGWYGLFSANSPGRVLCVSGGSYAAGATCHLWDYNASNVGDQKIRILPLTDGHYKFYFEHTGMSWDIPSGQTGDNVTLEQYTNNGNLWQEFCLQPVNAQAVGPNWRLTWSDQFTGVGNTPNTNTWNYDLGGGGWGNNELETYVNSAANAHVISDNTGTDNQALQIEAQTDANGNWYSARINTNGHHLIPVNSYVEYRCKFPNAGQGYWPAAWMLGTVGGTWPACGEIDIAEEVDGQSTNHQSLHMPGWDPTIATNPSAATTTYHNYGAWWTPTAVTFSVDGVNTVTFSAGGGGTWEFNSNNQFYCIINLAIGGGFPGNPNSSTQVNGNFDIDYVEQYNNN